MDSHDIVEKVKCYKELQARYAALCNALMAEYPTGHGHDVEYLLSDKSLDQKILILKHQAIMILRPYVAGNEMFGEISIALGSDYNEANRIYTLRFDRQGDTPRHGNVAPYTHNLTHQGDRKIIFYDNMLRQFFIRRF